MYGRLFQVATRAYSTKKQAFVQKAREQLAAEYEIMERPEDGIRIRIDPKAVKEFDVSETDKNSTNESK